MDYGGHYFLSLVTGCDLSVFNVFFTMTQTCAMKHHHFLGGLQEHDVIFIIYEVIISIRSIWNMSLDRHPQIKRCPLVT